LKILPNKDEFSWQIRIRSEYDPRNTSCRVVWLRTETSTRRLTPIADVLRHDLPRSASRRCDVRDISMKESTMSLATSQGLSEPIIPTATEARPQRAAHARATSGRRRLVDPTTCERDYSAEEQEFMHAMQAYKASSGRMFPTWSEVLEVLGGLGYQKPPARRWPFEPGRRP